jgi:hypothetical protein
MEVVAATVALLSAKSVGVCIWLLSEVVGSVAIAVA